MITVRLKKNKDADIRKGYPWIYAGDLTESSEWLLAEPGALAVIEDHRGSRIGTGYVNPKSQITCRVLTLSDETIDEVFFAKKIEAALKLRQKHISVPYYRLIHSEADMLSGLLVDRFGDILVVQVGSAGMEQLMPLWLPALERVIKPTAVMLRNDSQARKLEGLARDVKILKGEIPDLVELVENDTVYFADLQKGQKTGWFFDQRDNHKMMAELSAGKTLLDVFSHSGGFGVQAAKAGAKVVMVDSSALALNLAQKAAERNGVSALCEYKEGDAFAVMQSLAKEGRHYDVVIVDPPAFVKARKDIAAGLKGYEKVAKLAASLVAPGGLLFAASCSHHASRGAFNNATVSGAEKAGRSAVIVKQTSASPDHPRHPLLPQSEYLKGLLLKLD